MKTILIIFAILLFGFTASQAMAQQPVTEPSSSPGLTVNLENLNCFKSLQCIQKENLFANINLDKFKNGIGRYDGYTVEGSAEGEEIFAQYDYRGDLIQSTVTQRNIPLPHVISRQLINEEFNSWNMIGNERVIKNFDKKSIEYKLILQNDAKIRVVTFDHKGQNKNHLA